MLIRVLGEADANAYVVLRRQSLLDAPLAFAASPGDDVASSVEAVREQIRRAPDAVIVGAFAPELVGAVGLHRDRHIKAAHKAHVFGMYVAPSHRRQGMAARLLAAALDHARSLPGVTWVHLSVSAATPGAQRLYERAGFAVWGTEPEALQYDGELVAERHMAVRL